MNLLNEVHASGATICMVTHDPRFEACAERVVRLFDGRIIAEPADRHAAPEGVDAIPQ